MNRTKKLIYATLIATIWVAGPVDARERSISADVAYGDLDLTTTEGAAELERRARIAVLRLCGNYDRNDALGERPFRRCKRSARVNPTVEALVTQARLDATTRRDTKVAVR
ncbi:UrcA family protein [Altererythrobacter sp. Root672]|uniref:UrcA family protein n=1 Tax=Altererythrobacter sp. Root672 TaxID=1736584 RepID=UPI0007010041|nr:UrcA family protein [Altererythrobacter sp. Root672]KRA80690.1 hypothetical protein ASD76_16245 [Altererythrobacter sp. Root672]